MQVGRVLAGMEARDGAAVAGALHEARAEIIPPLAAGSTESYARAHPHLARLHMLQELQDAAALLQARPRPPCPRLPPATSCRVPPSSARLAAWHTLAPLALDRRSIFISSMELHAAT